MDPAERDDIAAMLREGTPADVVASRLIVPLNDVLEVLQDLRAAPHPNLTVAHQRPARTRPQLCAVPSSQEPAVTIAPPPIDETTPDVFTRAEAIDDRRVAKALTAAQEARDRLVRLVEEYEATSTARARIVELEAQLAAEKAKLTKPRKQADTRPAGDVSVNHRDVRAWADRNGITVPDRGVVPQAVVEQYLASPAAG